MKEKLNSIMQKVNRCEKKRNLSPQKAQA